MSTFSEPLGLGITAMSAYELQVWESLSAHWDKRNNRRGLPNWASNALERSGNFASTAVSRVNYVVPEAITQPIIRAGETVANTVTRPTLKALVSLLELTNDIALELNNPWAWRNSRARRI